MTGLLVRVASGEEAALAVAHGADLLEAPASLGEAELRAIAATAAGRPLVAAAPDSDAEASALAALGVTHFSVVFDAHKSAAHRALVEIVRSAVRD